MWIGWMRFGRLWKNVCESEGMLLAEYQSFDRLGITQEN